MISLARDGGRGFRAVLAGALGVWVVSGWSAIAYGDGFAGEVEQTHSHGFADHKNLVSKGTLGYGPPGLYPGYQGFGLSFHRGYGYGGAALGLGAEGGYPFYGGPGYPHTSPRLNRFGGITPFPYYGGPDLGYTNPPPVENYGPGYPNDGGFGSYTGPAPYPESYFAPFTDAAATTSSAGGGPPYEPFGGAEGVPPESRSIPRADQPSAPAPNPAGPAPNIPPGPSTFRAPGQAETARAPAQSQPLGIDTKPVVDTDGLRGLKITSLIPETVAANAGLRAGDIIRLINGYRIEQVGNLVWIIAHATPNNPLSMNVHKSADGEEHTVIVPLPLLRPLNTSRPPYLPVASNGPPRATR